MFNRIPMNLQLFADSGVESAPDAEVQVEIDSESPESGAEQEAAAEPGKESNFEKAFAKRLAAKEAEWQAKMQELEGKYKGFDDFKYVADYLQEAHGADLMSLKERIEMERLQARAEEHGIDPETQRRLETLEQKAAKADEMEAQQKAAKEWNEFQDSLKSFCEGKEIGGEKLTNDALWKYMSESNTSSPEVAYKAMRHDWMEKQLETAKKDGVKEFLAAKGSIPNGKGTTTSGTVPSPAPKTFAEARQRAMQRIGE